MLLIQDIYSESILTYCGLFSLFLKFTVLGLKKVEGTWSYIYFYKTCRNPEIIIYIYIIYIYMDFFHIPHQPAKWLWNNFSFCLLDVDQVDFTKLAPSWLVRPSSPVVLTSWRWFLSCLWDIWWLNVMTSPQNTVTPGQPLLSSWARSISQRPS